MRRPCREGRPGRKSASNWRRKGEKQRSRDLRIVTSTAIRSEILDLLTRPRNRELFDPRFDAEVWLVLVEFGAADLVEDSLGPRISDCYPCSGLNNPGGG